MPKDFSVELNVNSEGEIVPEDQGVGGFLSKYDLVKRMAEYIEAVPAENRNFEIITSGSDEFSTFTLQKGDGSTFDLKGLLPEGFKLRRTNSPLMGGNLKAKELFINVANVNKRGFILGLLHEIGHAHLKEPGHGMLNQKVDIELLKAATLVLRVGAGLLKDKFSGKNQKEREFERLQLLQSEIKDLLPSWYMEQFDTSLAKIERGSWAYALKNARKLEEKGFNVLAGFDSAEEVRDHISADLFTYEFDRLQRIARAEGTKNYIPKFVHAPKLIRSSRRKFNYHYSPKAK